MTASSARWSNDLLANTATDGALSCMSPQTISSLMYLCDLSWSEIGPVRICCLLSLADFAPARASSSPRRMTVLAIYPCRNLWQLTCTWNCSDVEEDISTKILARRREI